LAEHWRSFVAVCRRRSPEPVPGLRSRWCSLPPARTPPRRTVLARKPNLKIGQLLYGIATFIPGVGAVFGRGAGGTSSPRYCYSVWLRHLVSSAAHGLKVPPRVVAELGPGNSLGIGLSALLSGAERYHAFDVVPHAQVKRNLAVLDELIALFEKRADIPGPDEFPQVHPLLSSYAFPRRLLDEQTLA